MRMRSRTPSAIQFSHPCNQEILVATKSPIRKPNMLADVKCQTFELDISVKYVFNLIMDIHVMVN